MRVLAVTSVLALALAGCGGDDETSTSSSSTSTTTTEAAESDAVDTLGVTLETASAGEPGAVVLSVQEPSTRLREGDVITQVNGEPVESADQVADASGDLKLGDEVSLKVTRGSKSFPFVIRSEATSFLGVEVKDEKGGGAQVVSVPSNSPADEAGIQRGDVITDIAGTSIDGGDALSTAIATHDPGEEIEITLQRGSKELTVSATLVANPNAKP